MKALVTGGAGFIGSNLVEALVDDYEVTVLDNFHTGSMDNLAAASRDITVIKGSCNDAMSFGLKPDVIFHRGIPSSSPMYKRNPLLVGEAINDMVNIMELARQAGSQKVILASSSSLYNGLTPPHKEDMAIKVTDYYTEARLAIERMAELYRMLYGIDYAALRFFSVYGPHEEAKRQYANMISQFLWEMRAGKAPVIFGDGTQTRDFIYVKDLIEGIILASRKGTGILNLGTGKAHRFNDVINVLDNMLGTKIQPVYKDNPIGNYVMHTLADISKMKALGFEPKYTLEKGIESLVI